MVNHSKLNIFHQHFGPRNHTKQGTSLGLARIQGHIPSELPRFQYCLQKGKSLQCDRFYYLLQLICESGVQAKPKNDFNCYNSLTTIFPEVFPRKLNLKTCGKYRFLMRNEIKRHPSYALVYFEVIFVDVFESILDH